MKNVLIITGLGMLMLALIGAMTFITSGILFFTLLLAGFFLTTRGWMLEEKQLFKEAVDGGAYILADTHAKNIGILKNIQYLLIIALIIVLSNLI